MGRVKYDNDYREMVKTLYHNGHRVKDISKRLGIPANSVSTILRGRNAPNVKLDYDTDNMWERNITLCNCKKVVELDIWNRLKKAKTITLDGKIYDVVQITEHTITYRRQGGTIRESLSRTEIYQNPNLVEVV